MNELRILSEAFPADGQLQQILAHTSAAVFVKDLAGRIVFANREFERMRGVPLAQIVGRLDAELFPEDAQALRENDGRIIEERRAIDFEETVDTIRGRRVYLSHKFPLLDAAGKAYAVCGIATDITARRAAEDALRASEEQYRAIFNASADALVLWNSRLERVDVNPAFERMYGVTREAAIGSAYPADLEEEGVRRRMEIVRRTLAGESCHEDIESRRKDGSVVRVEVRTIPVQHRGEPHVLAMLRDVTELRRAEQAIRASEQQYRAIFNASEVGLLLCDGGHVVVDVNDAFVAMHGFRRDEVVGSAEPPFIPPTLRAEFATRVWRAIAGERGRYETQAKRRDGTLFDVELQCMPMQYRNLPHVLVAIRDITERREAEERLRASESRYRRLFEMESDAIVLTDAETLDLLDANRAAEKLWGYDREELLRLKATDLSAEAEATRGTHRDPHGNVSVALRWHRKKDGTVFPVEISLRRFMLDGREVALSTIRDIASRRDREEALASSETRLRATVEAALDCVIGIDGHGRLVEFNPAAERAFGYRREEVLGRSLASLIIPKDKRQAHEEGLAHFRRTGEGPYIGRRIETTALRADGTEFPIELAISVARAGDDDLFIGYLRDLTHVRATERRRGELEAQLRQAQKMEAIGHLTGGIAHDFNNLLASIMGYITLAAERAPADGKLAGYLDEAHASCTRARDLIQQMLTFSRGRRGEPRPLALAPAVRNAMRLLRSSFPATMSLAADLDEDATVKVDPVQLEQVLMNLAINARDATRSAGEVRIMVRRVRANGDMCQSCRKNVDGEMVELAVTDDGAGIAPEVRERMFEPFFTTKEVGRGSGMGLAMVHGIVHEHGGHILVDSAPGSGAAFRVLLPALESSAAIAPSPTFARRVLPHARLQGRVAVIDDEASVGGFMREMLERWNLVTTVFADAREALDAIAAGERFDLVITDQTMPRLSGLAFARAARDLDPRLPVVLYTGHPDQIDDAEVSAAGVVAVVQKPVDPHEMLDTLVRHLRERRAD